MWEAIEWVVAVAKGICHLIICDEIVVHLDAGQYMLLDVNKHIF